VNVSLLLPQTCFVVVGQFSATGHAQAVEPSSLRLHVPLFLQLDTEHGSIENDKLYVRMHLLRSFNDLKVSSLSI
jgi:hypothetical protein